MSGLLWLNDSRANLTPENLVAIAEEDRRLVVCVVEAFDVDAGSHLVLATGDADEAERVAMEVPEPWAVTVHTLPLGVRQDLPPLALPPS